MRRVFPWAGTTGPSTVAADPEGPAPVVAGDPPRPLAGGCTGIRHGGSRADRQTVPLAFGPRNRADAVIMAGDKPRLWAALSPDERELVAAALRSSSTSADLARLALLGKWWLAIVSKDIKYVRAQPTIKWRGGVDDHDRVEDNSLEAGESDDEQDRSTGEPWPPEVSAKRLLAKACRDNNVALVKQQIADGVPVDFFYGGMGNTPLFSAAALGHTECVRLLLGANAAIPMDSLSPQDYTSVYSAALWMGHLDVVRVVTEFGVPRWGRTFSLPEWMPYEEWDAEVEAKGACSKCSPERQLLEFLLETRRVHPSAGDPAVYTRLQVEEHVNILADTGKKKYHYPAICGLDFHAFGGDRGPSEFGGRHLVLELALPTLNMAALSDDNEVKTAAVKLLEYLEEAERDVLEAAGREEAEGATAAVEVTLNLTPGQQVGPRALIPRRACAWAPRPA